MATDCAIASEWSMEMVRFSVITVTYNAGNKLKETVTDVLRQTYNNYELLVKDGLSKDDSLSQLPVSDKIRVESCKDAGIYDAMNQAVSMAQGDYIIFMNCGDYFYDENVLGRLAEAIEAHPGCGIYYGDAYFRLSKEVLHMPGEITDFVCFRHIPCHQACIFARELWVEQGFDLNYKIRADYEFFLRQYCQKKAKPFYTGIVVADYEGGGYSESKENRKRDKREHRQICGKYMPKGKLFLYRFIMFITLQPLRFWIAQRSPLAGVYDRLKTKIYRTGK